MTYEKQHREQTVHDQLVQNEKTCTEIQNDDDDDDDDAN